MIMAYVMLVAVIVAGVISLMRDDLKEQEAQDQINRDNF